MRQNIGVDSGGTFTDTFIVDDNGRITMGKADSTPRDYSQGVIDSLQDGARSLGLSTGDLLKDTRFFAHGSTVVTNAMITRQGARTGLITTRGFEDTILIGRVHQKVAGRSEREIVDLVRLDKPEPIVPKPLIVGVTERVDYQGTVIVPLDIADAARSIERLIAQDVQSIAVCLLWSFMNPHHEREIARMIRERYSHIHVTLSSDLAPRLGEYERTATVAVNSYFGPLTARYIGELDGKLKALGLCSPLLMVQSLGGVRPAEEMRDRSAYLLGSGPAAGVMAAQFWGGLLGYENIICTDVGGTSFDVGLIVDGEPRLVGQIAGGYTILVPTVDVSCIGTGGGSIAWIEKETGGLRVGPQSAGAAPGPVCYDAGGTEPTVTDAAVALGYINPEYFLAGKKRLDKGKAMAAIQEKIADPLGMDVAHAAAGIYRISNSQMADLIRKVTIDRGRDPRDFVLFAYGGAGPQYAAQYAIEAGVKTVVIPPFAPVFCAFGAAVSDISTMRTVSSPMVAPVDEQRLHEIYAQLEQEVITELRRYGIRDEEMTLIRTVDMRFRRQVHEVRVSVPPGEITQEAVGRILADFVRGYESIYGQGTAYTPTGMEMISYAVRGVGKTVKPNLPKQPVIGPDASSAMKGRREAFFELCGGYVPVNVYDFDRLRPGNEIAGPAIIEAPATTIVLHPGQTARIDAYLNTIVETQREATPSLASTSVEATLDPVTFEVIRHRLWAINDEAASTVKRISCSPVATESGDFNTGLLDAEGNQLLVGVYVTGHAATQDMVVWDILREYQENPGIQPDDMFLCSDPYVGALHQSDVVCVAPIHWKGELVGWTATTIHQVDVGGAVVGGFAAGAKSIYDEPLPIPPIKIVERGVLRKDVERGYLIRSRAPALMALDLRAQIGANNVAKRRIHEIIEQYGVQTVKTVMREMISYVDARFKARLKELPDGTWRHALFLENDGVQEKIYTAHLSMTKRDDRLILDLSQSSEQAPALINTTYACLRGSLMTAVLPLMAYDMPWTPAGMWSSIDVISKPGTLVHAAWPAGCSAAPVSTKRLISLLANVCIGKMYSASPQYRDRAAASWGGLDGSKGSTAGSIISGLDKRGENFTTFLLDGAGCGGAGRYLRDGIDTGGSISVMATSTANLETNEYLFPVLYLYRRQSKDSGGPGRSRGGVGQEHAYTPYGSSRPFLSPVSIMGFVSECRTSSGINGGYPGSHGTGGILRDTNIWQLFEQGKTPTGRTDIQGSPAELPESGHTLINKGDVVTYAITGGGGYGDPLDRDPERVRSDVINDLVSQTAARETYGVVLTAELTVDDAGTQAQRDRIRGERRALTRRDFPDALVCMPEGGRALGEHLAIDQIDGMAVLRCRKCGAVLCDAERNYKACVPMEEHPITRAAIRPEPWEKTERFGFVIREFYCPGCSTMLDVECNLKDNPPMWDTQVEKL